MRCDYDRIILEETPQAERLAAYIAATWKPEKLLDLGCGPGIYVEACRKQKIQAWGMDPDDRIKFRSPYLFQRTIIQAAREFGAYTDMVLCLEVLEHIPEPDADANITALASIPASVILFSAAHPGQGGDGHVNCQPKRYWADKFKQRGWIPDLCDTEDFVQWLRGGYHMGWLAMNAMVLRRAR